MTDKTLKPSIVEESVYIQDKVQSVQLECTTASVDVFVLGVHSRGRDNQNKSPEDSKKLPQQDRLRKQLGREKGRSRKLSDIEEGIPYSSFEQRNKPMNSITDDVEASKPISKNYTKELETTDQTNRHKLMNRLRAARAREKKKAQAFEFTFDIDNTSSSSQSEQHEHFWGDASCGTSSLAIQVKDESNSEVELCAANSSHEVLPSLDLDPLKMEPNEDINVTVLMDSTILVSDFVALEMKRIRDANAIPSGDEDDDEEQSFKKAFQAERLRIENALNNAERQNKSTPQNLKFKEEEPTIDVIEFNSVNEWNPLDYSRDGSSEGEEIFNETFNLDSSCKTTKQQMQAERMRKLRARKKQLETPEEAFKRKENQRRRAERARLKRKALQAGVLIESDMDQKTDDEGNAYPMKAEQVTQPKRLTRFQAKQTFVATELKDTLTSNSEINSRNSVTSSSVKSRKQCLEDVLNVDLSCGSFDSHISSSDSVARNRTRCAQRARERRAAETIEETEARRLRARIAKMKNRLSAQLGISEDQLQAERTRKAEEMRLLRQKKRAAETPEQAAERKRKQVLQARKSRSRIQAAETPEETAARRAAGREYCRKRLFKLKEKETHEEKAERKERERHYRKQSKNLKLKTNSEVSNNSTINTSSLKSSNLELLTESSIMLLATSTSSTCPT